MKEQRLWKSLKYRDGKIVSDHDGSEWIIGDWRTVPAPRESCKGLNCCPYIADAMGYVSMDVLAEVEIGGKKIESDDKITSEKMGIIRAWKWKKMDSVALASYAAGLIEDNFNKQYPNDSRVKDCNALVRKYLEDPARVTGGELRSAYSAAYSAYSAARSAHSAAYSAAYSAYSAAYSAYSAAHSAAYSADSAAYSADSAAYPARKKMKDKIQKWIINHLSECEEL